MKVPKGFLFSGIHCGIKRKKLDLGLIYSKNPSKAAGVFTKNSNVSYSVKVSKENINNPINAILVNSGNANCYSHKQGLKDTQELISKLAENLKINKENVLIASTGIIGKKLPKEKIIKNLPKLIKNLGETSENFSQSILTTDTFKKVSFVEISAGNDKGAILGFAKGAGMICPNMATMLGFILTDIDVPKGIFKKIAKEAIDLSFNSISVDACMSTNDTVFFISSKKIALKNKNQIKIFSKKMKNVCLDLAKMIVKDAEGATKFVEIEVRGAKSIQEAKKAGFSLSNSNLFKSALFGASSNWGRVISSLGQANIKVQENISIKSSSLKKKDVKISIDLKTGNCSWKVYTCDLTPEYVKINAEYS